MNIYTFKPTFLYIKQHKITGLKYFGKTTKTEYELLHHYYGSGVYWKRHIAIHGKEHVETIWYKLFTDYATLTEFAIKFSQENNIVLSHSFANLVEENGLDGSTVGTKHTVETCKKISEARTGMKFSDEHCANLKAALKTRDTSYITDEYRAILAESATNISDETRAKRSASHKGKIKSPEHLANIGAALKGKKLSEEHKQKLREGHARRKQAKLDLA